MFIFKGNAREYFKELDATKHELNVANGELDSYRKRLTEQCEAVKEIEVKILQNNKQKCTSKLINEIILPTQAKFIILYCFSAILKKR